VHAALVPRWRHLLDGRRDDVGLHVLIGLHPRAGSRDDDVVNETWATTARYLSRYRGALMGGVGSAVAVAVTLDPRANIATSSIKFAVSFAMVATLLAIGITMAHSVAEYRASRLELPRATARKRSAYPLTPDTGAAGCAQRSQARSRGIFSAP
jgi:hypothetical protein